MIKLPTIISKILALILFIFCLGSCASQNSKQLYKEKRNEAFKAYMTAQKIPFKELNDSIFSAHYGDFLNFERKIKLESNPYLKINKVYVHYRTPESLEFIVYSDKETFCISTSDLDIDGKVLSFPENGVIKVLQPVTVEDFGDFELTDNIIKTRKKHTTPFSQWYDYVIGTIKNDTIYFTEKFIGKEKAFKKKLFTRTKKTDFKEVYQPKLKARRYINETGLISYEVTGEFNIKK
jgi:hypothetical protein